jgi:hypothetical protein
MNLSKKYKITKDEHIKKKNGNKLIIRDKITSCDSKKNKELGTKYDILLYRNMPFIQY